MIIAVNGVIGQDVLAADIKEQLEEANGQPVQFDVNSPGGSVYEAISIFNAIRDYPGKTTVKIEALAASAASYICCAADEVIALDNSIWMDHNAWGACIGDYRDMRKTASILENTTNLMAVGYSAKSGKELQKVKAELDEETWLYGEEIKTAGYADVYVSSGSSDNNVVDFEQAKQQFQVAAQAYQPDKGEIMKIAAYLKKNQIEDPEEEARVQAIRMVMKQQSYNLELQETGEKAIRDKTPHFVAQTQMFVKMRDFGLSDEDIKMCETMNLTHEEYWKHNYRPEKY